MLHPPPTAFARHRFFDGRRPCPVACVCLTALLALTGCGESGPRTIEVRGTVTYQGTPLEGGTISFFPTRSHEGLPRRPALGQIESDGTYQLTTFANGDGVLPGEYTVAVTSLIGAPPLTAWEESPPKRESRIPRKYNTFDTSGLSAAIPADGDGALNLDFDLQ